ncbi:Chitin deacetylase 4, partial [Operophtera brumata]
YDRQWELRRSSHLQAFLSAPAPITETPLDLATKCDTAECQLPYCFCSKDVFNGKLKNPNGCAVRGTFFLSHEYSNYVMVQSLAHDGHEIATGTVSQQQGLQDKGYEEWAGEMIGMREILKKFANVSRAEIVGTRAPFLKPGRNTQFKVPFNAHFVETYEGGHCPYLDQCVLHNHDSDEAVVCGQDGVV